jgi:hypothetical protein
MRPAAILSVVVLAATVAALAAPALAAAGSGSGRTSGGMSTGVVAPVAPPGVVITPGTGLPAGVPGVTSPGVSTGIIPDDPEAIHQAYLKRAEEAYTLAVKARAAGDIPTAIRLFLEVADMLRVHLDSPYPQKSAEELQAIAAQGTRELAVARALVAGDDPAAGLDELHRIARIYAGLEPGKLAGAQALLLDTDPQFQATLRAGRLAQDLKKAAALEAEAAALATGPAAEPAKIEPGKTPPADVPGVVQKMMSDKERETARVQRLLDAYEAYGRIVQAGADTEPAKQAAAARARLEKDGSLMARLKQAQAERKAREYLGLAEAYVKAGRQDRAKEFCQKILAECPDTPQVVRAKEILGSLK